MKSLLKGEQFKICYCAKTYFEIEQSGLYIYIYMTKVVKNWIRLINNLRLTTDVGQLLALPIDAVFCVSL